MKKLVLAVTVAAFTAGAFAGDKCPTDKTAAGKACTEKTTAAAACPQKSAAACADKDTAKASCCKDKAKGISKVESPRGKEASRS